MKGMLYLAILLVAVVAVAAGNLKTMPVVNMDTVESPSFNAAVQAYINKYGTNAITLDAVIETD